MRVVVGPFYIRDFAREIKSCIIWSKHAFVLFFCMGHRGYLSFHSGFRLHMAPTWDIIITITITSDFDCVSSFSLSLSFVYFLFLNCPFRHSLC
ncbi:hypothetical protein B0T17DRAFT_375025 [Bombardia bombarda]|uniref:Uncharacterized protein n=1 Tax=Bombardia bombarda TaxID=252184 RepID=A0AA39WGJ8_9PEZI|nr:hypothetical protein B0T17DRAFT_375025 [Bombardia bombarda]